MMLLDLPLSLQAQDECTGLVGRKAHCRSSMCSWEGGGRTPGTCLDAASPRQIWESIQVRGCLVGPVLLNSSSS